MSGASGNTDRSRRRVHGEFAAWWAPWSRCWKADRVEIPRGAISDVVRLGRCALRRGHLGRCAWTSGFDVHYFGSEAR